MFSYVSTEQRIPIDHPIRTIRALTNEVLAALSADFKKMYSELGRPSIPPEKLLRAVADSVYDSKSATVDGANGLQPAVPLVRGLAHE
jgi:hypothetical protein